VRFAFTVSLLFSCLFFESAFAKPDCPTLLSTMVSHPLRHEDRIVLVPGKEVDYSVGVSSRLDDAFLEVNADDDLEAMAKVLAQGNSYQSILRKLRKNAREYPTQISLKELAPWIVAEQTNRFPLCNGPNCYNATLNWFDPSVGIKATTHAEILNALNDPTQFRPLLEGVQLEFGDVMVILQHEDGEVDIRHTAIYLNEHVVWHKAGWSWPYPWTFELMENVLKDYALYKEPVEIHFYRRVKQPW
jgi:hypothetical protein